MKKILQSLLVILLTVSVLPINAMADGSKVVATSLEEACIEEGISYDHDDFVNSTDKANIYLFRGNGCSHCHNFLVYLESIVDEYGDKFNVVTFEVWNNEDNAELMDEVAGVFGDNSGGGVPYVIIGERTFIGYSEEMNDSILEAIDVLYSSEEKYDIMSYLDSQNYFEETKSNSTPALVVIEIINIIVFSVIIVNIKRKYDKQSDKLIKEIKYLRNQIEEKNTSKKKTGK